MTNAVKLFALSVTIALLATGCNNHNDNKNNPTSYAATEVVIAHINDHHSHLEAEGSQKFTLDGQTYKVERGGFARIKQLYDELQDQYSNTNFLKLHAGDAMTGTVYYSFYKGKADADLMNTICFDAFELGNHEFDDGDENLKNFIDYLNAGSCQTPVLAANVKPKVGTPLAPKAVDDYIKPYIIRTTKEGVKVGIIGLDIAGKTKNSSRPLDTTEFLDETTTAQNYINELQNKGIQHIILLTHYTYANDKKLAANLTGVDAIIGGDSHTLLGDFKQYDTAGNFGSQGDYPTIITNKDGNKVCIGQAWEYTKALGLMKIKFNQQGNVESCGGSAIIPVGQTFFKLQPKTNANDKDVFAELTAADNQTLTNKLLAGKANLLTQDLILPVTENKAAITALATYKNKLSDNMSKNIATTSQALCLVRVPGTTRSADIAGCENSATAARGSDIAQIVAHSFLDASLRADFALQNAGGVRIPLKAGNITNQTAYDLLPFSNTLVNFDMTGQQVIDTLEDGVANHMDKDGSSGSHPYADGLRWDLQLNQTKGNRIKNVEVRNRKTGQWSTIDVNKTYVMVTNDYIASGKDGYSTMGTIFKNQPHKVEDTKLLYTQSFIDYVTKVGNISRPNRADYSHKTVVTKEGKLLNP